MTITLHPGSVSLKDLETIYWTGAPARLDPAFDAGIAKAAARIAEIAAGNAPVYGINTGFGKLASIKIDSADVATLQRNLILSHCCGIGAPLPENIVRLIMTLDIEGRAPALLTTASDPLAFPADIPVAASLQDGAITDLNVMLTRLLGPAVIGRPGGVAEHEQTLLFAQAPKIGDRQEGSQGRCTQPFAVRRRKPAGFQPLRLQAFPLRPVSCMIATRDGATCHFDIYLQGANETVFLDI